MCLCVFLCLRAYIHKNFGNSRQLSVVLRHQIPLFYANYCMQLLDGSALSQQVKDQIKAEVSDIVQTGKRPPHLAAILVGEDGGSLTYVSHKMKACEYVGFRSSLFHYADISEADLLAKIAELNADPELDGFIVQLPLPKHINEQRVLEAVAPQKDVDGFHPQNIGNLVLNVPCLQPATPSGIIEILAHYGIETAGKHCVVIGRSRIVGRPVSVLLSRGGAQGECTVTLCHSRTPKEMLHTFTKMADIVVVATGKPGTLTGDMVKDGVVIIDVGTTRVPAPDTKSGWRLMGDVAFDSVAPKASHITPVPGGVGPMTVAMLLKNTLLAYKGF